jgi:hypothetical protein
MALRINLNYSLQSAAMPEKPMSAALCSKNNPQRIADMPAVVFLRMPFIQWLLVPFATKFMNSSG